MIGLSLENSQRQFNILTMSLPRDVEFASGRWLRINTSAARAIDALEVLEDEELPETIRYDYMIRRLVEEGIPEMETPEELAELVTLLKLYLAGPNTGEYEPSGLPRSEEPMIYWSLDSQAIVSSMRQAYGLSLEEMQSMHWWEFRSLLFGIPSDTRMGQLFATRSEVVDPKLDGNERLMKERMKKASRPKDTRTLEQKEEAAMRQLANIL